MSDNLQLDYQSIPPTESGNMTNTQRIDRLERTICLLISWLPGGISIDHASQLLQIAGSTPSPWRNK